METLIDKKVNNLIATFTETHKDDNNFKKLLEANEQYNKLIKEGVIKRRGNTLASPAEIYTQVTVINQFALQ